MFHPIGRPKKVEIDRGQDQQRHAEIDKDDNDERQYGDHNGWCSLGMPTMRDFRRVEFPAGRGAFTQPIVGSQMFRCRG
jgi:hypothetical protein